MVKILPSRDNIHSWTYINGIQDITRYPLSIDPLGKSNIICNTPVFGEFLDRSQESEYGLLILDEINFEENLKTHSIDNDKEVDFQSFIKYIKYFYGNYCSIFQNTDKIGYQLINKLEEKEFVKYLYKRFKNIDLNGWI